MRRRFTLKQLGDMAKIVEEYRGKARMVRQIHTADLKGLDSADAKRKYKPEHLIERKQSATSEALTHLRKLGLEVVAMVQPALAERGLHSKETHLREAGFRDEVPDLADKHEQALRQTLADLSVGVRQLTFVMRLARLPDEQLLTTCEAAVQSGDVGLVGLIAEEAACRNDSLLKLKVDGMVNQIAVPDADTATAALACFEDVVQEFAEIARAIGEPDNLFATVGVRSRAINEATAAREAAEAAAAAKAKQEADEQAAAAAKAATDEYLKKGEKLPTAPPPVPVIDTTPPPAA
jgi:hypothetical protein